ncbi:hypothetical protein HMPREF3226_02217 [Prevotella corporis]|uniref:Uncharacterized protein n=1 Tax=Prevotella corporis TaxID=28128 RepID=A0A133PXM5_9BACT|nr:hypothetical protein HMPREF3226_02217 [Prevotella corporis]
MFWYLTGAASFLFSEGGGAATEKRKVSYHRPKGQLWACERSAMAMS